jgi:hypothetical protein
VKIVMKKDASGNFVATSIEYKETADTPSELVAAKQEVILCGGKLVPFPCSCLRQSMIGL